MKSLILTKHCAYTRTFNVKTECHDYCAISASGHVLRIFDVVSEFAFVLLGGNSPSLRQVTAAEIYESLHYVRIFRRHILTLDLKSENHWRAAIC